MSSPSAAPANNSPPKAEFYFGRAAIIGKTPENEKWNLGARVGAGALGFLGSITSGALKILGGFGLSTMDSTFTEEALALPLHERMSLAKGSWSNRTGWGKVAAVCTGAQNYAGYWIGEGADTMWNVALEGTTRKPDISYLKQKEAQNSDVRFTAKGNEHYDVSSSESMGRFFAMQQKLGKIKTIKGRRLFVDELRGSFIFERENKDGQKIYSSHCAVNVLTGRNFSDNPENLYKAAQDFVEMYNANPGIIDRFDLIVLSPVAGVCRGFSYVGLKHFCDENDKTFEEAIADLGVGQHIDFHDNFFSRLKKIHKLEDTEDLRGDTVSGDKNDDEDDLDSIDDFPTSSTGSAYASSVNKQFRHVKIPGDGHCQFRAFAYNLCLMERKQEDSDQIFNENVEHRTQQLRNQASSLVHQQMQHNAQSLIDYVKSKPDNDAEFYSVTRDIMGHLSAPFEEALTSLKQAKAPTEDMQELQDKLAHFQNYNPEQGGNSLADYRKQVVEFLTEKNEGKLTSVITNYKDNMANPGSKMWGDFNAAKALAALAKEQGYNTEIWNRAGETLASLVAPLPAEQSKGTIYLHYTGAHFDVYQEV